MKNRKVKSTMDQDLQTRQAEIDMVSSPDFIKYWKSGLETTPAQIAALCRRLPALGRLEDAFEKVFREARETVVDDIDHPAVWFVYNMGLVVKTTKTMFSIDLHHRRAEEFAPFLDFALITHNHNDHYTEPFKFAMDRKEHKTVVNNFFDNYGITDRKLGGYTRARSKKFVFGDVTIVTGTCDHNDYLKNYTTTFEVRIGKFTIFHSGDCSNHSKLRPSRRPDLWVLHPRCGMDAAKACAEAVHPKTAVVAHLQEIGHPIGQARWTYQDGLNEVAKIEAAGFHAVMPLWGDRLA